MALGVGNKGWLVGRVVRAGEPFAGVDVVAENASGRASSLTRVDGVFGMKLRAGEWRLAVVWRGLGSTDDTRFEVGPVGVVAGQEKEQEIAIEAGSLEGKILDPTADDPLPEVLVSIEVVGANGSSGRASRLSGSDGSFRVNPCPVGEARIRVADKAEPLATATVSPGKPAQVTVRIARERIRP